MKQYKLNSNSVLAMNSSGGQLLKWKLRDTYIKTSTLDKQSLDTKFMYESYAEVIVSRMANRLGLDTVKYKLCEVIIDNNIKTIACESKDFKPKDYKELSFGKLMQLGKIRTLQYNNIDVYYTLIEDIYKLFGVNIQPYIDTIIVLDAITLNDDRHYGNFGVMVNGNMGTRAIPIFDNGNSLFCHKYTKEIKYAEDLVQYLRFKPFSINCNTQLSLVKSNPINGLNSLKEYIPRLLSEMVEYGLPIDRSVFIKELLYSRINYVTQYFNLK